MWRMLFKYKYLKNIYTVGFYVKKLRKSPNIPTFVIWIL